MNIQIQMILAKEIHQVIGKLADQILAGLIGQKLTQGNHIGPGEGNENDAVEVILFLDDFNDLDHIRRFKGIFQFQHADFAILLANLHVFLQRRNAQIAAALFLIHITKLQIAQGVKGALFHRQIINGHPGGGIIMNANKFPVQGAMNVGFNAKIAAMAKCSSNRNVI